MGDYTLDCIVALPVSPHSYGKPLDKMRPSSSTMTIYGTFMQSSVPLEEEKEDKVVKDWIYIGEEDDNKITLTTPISPKRNGKGYQFLKKMGYHG